MVNRAAVVHQATPKGSQGGRLSALSWGSVMPAKPAQLAAGADTFEAMFSRSLNIVEQCVFKGAVVMGFQFMHTEVFAAGAGQARPAKKGGKVVRTNERKLSAAQVVGEAARLAGCAPHE